MAIGRHEEAAARAKRAIEGSLRACAAGSDRRRGRAQRDWGRFAPAASPLAGAWVMVSGTMSAVDRPLETIEEPPLATLRDYWREAVAERAVLPRSELRPERFARALEHTALVERIETPRSGHRIRLCGSDMENRDFGIHRGAFLEDARPPWYRDHLVEQVSGAIARTAPVYQRVEAVIDGKSFAFTRLMLPLASGSNPICDMLLVATVRPSSHLVSAIRARLALA